MCFVVSFPPPDRIVSLNTLYVQVYDKNNDGYNNPSDLTGCSALSIDPLAFRSAGAIMN